MREESIPVAFLIATLHNGGTQSISIFKNEQFYLGRNRSLCRAAWDDPLISNKHLRIYCTIFDDNDLSIPPLVYAEDLSSNGTLITASDNDQLTGMRTLSLKNFGATAVLLNDNDVLHLSPAVSLRYIAVHKIESPQIDTTEEFERKALSESYSITSRSLGAGGHGSVYVAIEPKTLQQFACKIIDISRSGKSERALQGESSKHRSVQAKRRILDRACREFEVLRETSHPNIISLEKVYCGPNRIYIFQEFLPGGDLYSYLNFNGGRLSDVEAAVIIRQILEAVKYLHHNGIVHRDLKPDNILLSTLSWNARIVLTDFGSARFLPRAEHVDGTLAKSRMFSVAGTTEYAAPEIHSANPLMGKNSGYTEAADMWSIGCITAVLLSGDIIFVNREHEAFIQDPQGHILDLAGQCDLSVIENSSVWERVSRRPKDFLKKLLVLDESERMSAQQALDDPWLNNPYYKEELDLVYARSIKGWQPRTKQSGLVESLKLNPDRQQSTDSDAPDTNNQQQSTSAYFHASHNLQGSRSDSPVETEKERALSMVPDSIEANLQRPLSILSSSRVYSPELGDRSLCNVFQN